MAWFLRPFPASLPPPQKELTANFSPTGSACLSFPVSILTLTSSHQGANCPSAFFPLLLSEFFYPSMWLLGNAPCHDLTPAHTLYLCFVLLLFLLSFVSTSFSVIISLELVLCLILERLDKDQGVKSDRPGFKSCVMLGQL